MKFENLKLNEIYKFVEVDGEFIFLHYFESHKQYVPKGRVAESAGMVGVKVSGLKIVDGWSMTCKVGIGDLGAIRMANALNTPVWFEGDEPWVPPITELPDYLRISQLKIKLMDEDASKLASTLRDIWIEDPRREDISDLDKRDIINGIVEWVEEGVKQGHWTEESWFAEVFCS